MFRLTILHIRILLVLECHSLPALATVSCKIILLHICLYDRKDPSSFCDSIANSISSHLGRGVTLRLIRNTEECDGLEEMRPIDQNLQYDFNFQQFTVLPNEITVRRVSTGVSPSNKDLGWKCDK